MLLYVICIPALIVLYSSLHVIQNVNFFFLFRLHNFWCVAFTFHQVLILSKVEFRLAIHAFLFKNARNRDLEFFYHIVSDCRSRVISFIRPGISVEVLPHVSVCLSQWKDVWESSLRCSLSIVHARIMYCSSTFCLSQNGCLFVKKKKRGKVIQRGSADTVVFLRLYFCSCRWIVLQGVDLAAFIGWMSIFVKFQGNVFYKFFTKMMMLVDLFLLPPLFPSV